MARIRICVIGPPQIEIEGRPLTLNHLKAKALLYYLAASGQPLTRETLATLLWSESGPEEARHSLRSSLYHLRQALRSAQVEAALKVDGEWVGLFPDLFECDWIEFQGCLDDDARPSLERAVALYRGPFLQGFSLPDAPVFDEWLRGEDARLGQACYTALDRLTGWAEGDEAWAAAADYVRQMIRIDPLAENAQQRLMRLYLRQGEAGLAVRQYRQFEGQLQQELGLEPSPETRALLYDALRRQGGAATANPPVFQPRGLPFTGRDRLLDQLSDLSQEARTGRGMTVLLQGEAGIGKTRLLDELISRLVSGSPPWMVLQGACSPFDDLLSYGPFLEALQNGALEDLTSLLAGPDRGVPDARGRFSWSVLQTLRSLSKSAPLLLVIEDLQWANSSTLNLFGFLSMRLRHLPVLLVGTVQYAEAVPALRRLISLGRRRGDLHLFSLTPLTLGDVAGLLQGTGVTPGPVDTLAEWLHTRSGGSPFLLTEILAQMRAEAILQPAGNGWQLDAIHWLRWRTTFTLPETAHDLVAWRLANLSADARQLLNILAVAGQPLPAGVLGEFFGGQAGALLTWVDDLAARGLIAEAPTPAPGSKPSGTSGLTLPHHLLREALLHQLSDLRRRTIHQQLAQALEVQAPAGDPAWVHVVALHAVAGEDVARARRYALPVLAGLPQEYTGAETLDFVRHLLDLLAPSATPGEMVQLTRALGLLHQTLGHPETAAGWHRQNLAWAQKAGDPSAQAEAHFEMSELALTTHDYRTAAQAAEAGLATIEALEPAVQEPGAGLQPLVGRGHRLLGAALAMEGSDLSAAESHLQQAAALHRQARDQGDLCAALFELGNIAAQRGDLRRALDFYTGSRRAAEAGHIHYYLALACNNFAYHSLLLGEVEAAKESTAQGVKVAEAYDLLAALLHLYSTQGEIHLYLGEWDEAQESFRRGLALAEDLGSLERQAGYRGGLALAARGNKDPDSAVRLLEEALALIADQGYWHLRTRLQLWLAEILFDQGRFERVAPLLDAAVEIALAHRRTLLLAQAQRLRARLLAACGDWPAAEALFAAALESASGLGLPLEIARVQAAWGDAALHASPTPEEGRALIAAARAVLSACGARADLARL